MRTINILITVTEKHIEEASKPENSSNGLTPLDFAWKEVEKQYYPHATLVDVGNAGFVVYFGVRRVDGVTTLGEGEVCHEKDLYLPFPDETRKLMARWEGGEDIKPFSFTLEKEYLQSEKEALDSEDFYMFG